MRSLDPRLPVLVGLGAASTPAPVVDLMTDCGVGGRGRCRRVGLLRHVDRIAVPQGTWSLTDPARTVARRIGSPARARSSARSASPNRR